MGGKTVVAVVAAGLALLLGLLVLLPDSDPVASAADVGSSCQDTSVITVGADTGVPNGWGPKVVAAAKVAGLPASLLAAQLEAESGWNPNASSPVGARGLAQFMPATWLTWGNGGDILNPLDAIAAQGRFMGSLRASLTGLATLTHVSVQDLALAGYNAGAGAVEMFNGVPPYPETQGYVAKIKAMAAAKYASLDGKTSSANTADLAGASGCGGGSVQAGKGDDLPWSHAPILTASPLGMFNRECVDFVLWRMNQAAGTTKAPYKFTNSNFRGDGQLLGSANSIDSSGNFLYSWKDGWDVKGWPSGKTPKVGSVVYYGPQPGNPYGHVAWVKALNSDGTFLEEGYNIDLGAGANHAYYTRVVPNTAPTAFLYMDL